MIVGSAADAAQTGKSLALIRPRNTRFRFKAKPHAKIEQERESYRRAARQVGFFDRELAEFEPTPYEFRFSFEDAAGRHDYANGDWEAHAMFRRERLRTDEARALAWMSERFNDEYPRAGMVFAIGNMASRPQTWQLLGVIRLDERMQEELLL